MDGVFRKNKELEDALNLGHIHVDTEMRYCLYSLNVMWRQGLAMGMYMQNACCIQGEVEMQREVSSCLSTHMQVDVAQNSVFFWAADDYLNVSSSRKDIRLSVSCVAPRIMLWFFFFLRSIP